jgi:hypothetical protein
MRHAVIFADSGYSACLDQDRAVLDRVEVGSCEDQSCGQPQPIRHGNLPICPFLD